MNRNTTKSVDDCHQLLLWIIPLLTQFPRSHRFTLGTRVEEYLLDVLENLLKATWQANKKQHLAQANIHLEMTRHLWRLCYDLRIISSKRYEYGIRLMLGLGKQIGGWSHSLR
jgi:hypothetical protein